VNDKIVAVVDKMLAEPQWTSEILKSGIEYYFRYKGAYFSIIKRTQITQIGTYSLFVYPKWTGSIKDLADFFDAGPEPDDVPMVAYHENDFDDRKMSKKLAELYSLIANKYLNIDDLLNGILQ
jgi:hypothetical protein